MKKLLGILVLGLLFSGNVYAGMYKGIQEQGANYIILKKKREIMKVPLSPNLQMVYKLQKIIAHQKDYTVFI